MRISDWSSDVCSSDLQQAEQLTYEVLTNGLLPDTLQGLDDLLARRSGQATTWLSWLRNAPQSPAARTILRLIERLAYVRALALARARAHIIPAFTFYRQIRHAASRERVVQYV